LQRILAPPTWSARDLQVSHRGQQVGRQFGRVPGVYVVPLARSACVETPAFETRFRARAGVACQIKWALPGVWGAAAAPRREWHLDDQARVLLEFGQVWMSRWGA
jgi:hypothetical protein